MPSIARHVPPRRATSLIELVIVVLLVGIVSAVAAPRFASTLSHYRAETAARRIRADLNFARRQAKSSGQERTVTFSPVTNSYQLLDVPDPDHSDQAYVVELSETGNSASLVSVDFDGELSLTFDVYGRPRAGSPLAPLSSGTIVVAAGEWQSTVVVNATTGKADLP